MTNRLDVACITDLTKFDTNLIYAKQQFSNLLYFSDMYYLYILCSFINHLMTK